MKSVDAIRSQEHLQLFERELLREDSLAFDVWRTGLSLVLRISDTLAITVLDTKRALKRGELRIVEGKTGKAKVVQLSETARSALASALKRAEASEWVYLFEGRGRNRKPGQPLSRRAVSYWFSSAAEILNLKTGEDYRVGTHSMRKSAGFLMRNAGVDLAIISHKVFQHASPAITARYLGLVDADTTSALDSLSALIGSNGDSHLQRDWVAA